MKPTIAALLACSVLTALPQQAAAWGGDGHRTVGMIADLILEQHPTTRDKVRQILGESLSEASLHADCAKGFRYCNRDPTPEEKAYAQRNSNHHDYHYTDVPIQQGAYKAGTAGTADNDIVLVLAHAINVLRGKAPNEGPATLSEREALWLIAHHKDLFTNRDRPSTARERKDIGCAHSYDDLKLLRDLDDAGRVPGMTVGTIDDALDYIRALEREDYLDG